MEGNANKLHIYRFNFVIHPQTLIFSVFKIVSFSPYGLQIIFSMTMFFYLFTLAINLWHQKFVTQDVTAVFVNNQHGIQRREQDFYIFLNFILFFTVLLVCILCVLAYGPLWSESNK